jgi:hypothetical protein
VSSVHTYDHKHLALEFEPEKGWSSGFLNVINTEADETTFGARVDIASSKSVTTFVKDTTELYSEAFPPEDLTLRKAINELRVLVNDADKTRKAKAEEEDDDEEEDVLEANAPEQGSERYDAAMGVLQDDDILERAAETMQKLGHVGEWSNKKLAFTCAVSARAQLPVQPSTHAETSAGKNYLWDKALALFPPEKTTTRSGMSAKALFRTEADLRYGVLYIQEVKGSEDADFSIRVFQSDGRLEYEVPEKQPDGSIKNAVYCTEGPTVIVQTTTRNHLHPENETRVLPIYLDESAEQTGAITDHVLRRAAGKGTLSKDEEETLCEAWHDAIRLLKSAEVIVPFAEGIQVPKEPLRIRRDLPRLLNVIRIVAWLHQYSRPRDAQGRICATADDFDVALKIVGDSLSRAWKMLTPPEETVLEACQSLNQHLKLGGFKKEHVEKILEKRDQKMPPRTLQKHLRTLDYNGYLDSDGGKGRPGATYTLASAPVITQVITLPAHLRIPSKMGDISIGKANRMRKETEEEEAKEPGEVNVDYEYG